MVCVCVCVYFTSIKLAQAHEHTHNSHREMRLQAHIAYDAESRAWNWFAPFNQFYWMAIA